MSDELFLFWLGWIVRTLGAVAVVGALLFAAAWSWAALITNSKNFRTLMFLTRLRLRGKKSASMAFWNAYVDQINSEHSAYEAVRLAKEKYPDCESYWSKGWVREDHEN